MNFTALAAAIKGGYEVFKTARRTFWHAGMEMLRGNLQRKKYPGFEETKNEKPVQTGSDDWPCGDA